MLNLNDVTLVAIDGVGTDQLLLKAVKYSIKNIDFNSIKYFTCSDYELENSEKILIEKMSWNECQKFTLTILPKHIDTKYMLLIQNDGFVVNPHLWNNEFLKYDYIGASWNRANMYHNTTKWPIVHRHLTESNLEYNVGNGGFTLRSSKLMKRVSELYTSEYDAIPEDLVIAVCMRKQLEEEGFVFAPTEVAFKFSCEIKNVDGINLSSDNTFGFHCDESHPDKFKLLETI
jgi:hypothetical protein